MYENFIVLDSNDAKKGLDMVWWYFLSKFIDYFDSLFFLMRKKWSHLSSLHVSISLHVSPLFNVCVYLSACVISLQCIMSLSV